MATSKTEMPGVFVCALGFGLDVGSESNKVMKLFEQTDNRTKLV